MSEPLFFLYKGGKGYYSPEAKGYTYERSEAGTFTKEYAQQHVIGTHGEVEAIPVPQPEEGSYILVSNLESALIRACADAAWLGKSQSAFVKGLESNLDYLRKHGTLTIRS